MNYFQRYWNPSELVGSSDVSGMWCCGAHGRNFVEKMSKGGIEYLSRQSRKAEFGGVLWKKLRLYPRKKRMV